MWLRGRLLDSYHISVSLGTESAYVHTPFHWVLDDEMYFAMCFQSRHSRVMGFAGVLLECLLLVQRKGGSICGSGETGTGRML